MKQTIFGLGVVVVILILVTTLLVLFNRPILAVAIGAGAVSVFLLLVILASFGAGLLWSRETMREGAEIALRGKEADSAKDAVQIKAIADLTKILLKQQQDIPALPLPSQQPVNWLPQLEDMD